MCFQLKPALLFEDLLHRWLQDVGLQTIITRTSYCLSLLVRLIYGVIDPCNRPRLRGIWFCCCLLYLLNLFIYFLAFYYIIVPILGDSYIYIYIYLFMNGSYFISCILLWCQFYVSLWLTTNISRFSSFNFPALTTLSLKHLAFCINGDSCAKPFFAFNKLNALIIDYCVLKDDNAKKHCITKPLFRETNVCTVVYACWCVHLNHTNSKFEN